MPQYAHSLGTALRVLTAFGRFEPPSPQDARELRRVAEELGIREEMAWDELACEVITTVVKRTREDAKPHGV
jgi:hypothetical protein